jgi:hypothetical protein
MGTQDWVGCNSFAKQAVPHLSSLGAGVPSGAEHPQAAQIQLRSTVVLSLQGRDLPSTGLML